MATLAASVPESPRPSAWFWEFLKEELAPYPGRVGTVARMVIAATLVMIICMTFRISYGFQAAIFTLIISRENPRATLQSAGTMLLVTCVGAAYILISAWFVISVPMLHFFWIIVSFFAAFYALGTMTNYGTVVVFAAVELAFARMKPGDDIVLPIAERLAAVQSLLACYVEDRPVDDATERKITRLAMLGTSTLRRVLRRSDYSSHYRAEMSGVAALVGGLVDVAATLTQARFGPSGPDQKQLRELAATIASIRTDLINRRIPGSIQFRPDNELSRSVPLLREMEKVVTLIPQAFAGHRSLNAYLPPSDDLPRSKLVVPDALTNPEHLRFALKGCLAASACYIIYNAIAWPGISTAVTTPSPGRASARR